MLRMRHPRPDDADISCDCGRWPCKRLHTGKSLWTGWGGRDTGVFSVIKGRYECSESELEEIIKRIEKDIADGKFPKCDLY